MAAPAWTGPLNAMRPGGGLRVGLWSIRAGAWSSLPSSQGMSKEESLLGGPRGWGLMGALGVGSVPILQGKGMGSRQWLYHSQLAVLSRHCSPPL